MDETKVDETKVDDKESPKQKPSRLQELWRSWVRPILTVVVVLTTFRSAVADWNDVPTGSMKPTIMIGDRIFVNKLAYGLQMPFTHWPLWDWGNPKRGEIITFNSPADDTLFVKRVIGVPGDIVELRDNKLFINDQPASYESVSGEVREETFEKRTHPVMNEPGHPELESYGPVQVPEGHYFVMGDNRDNSFDSRFFGFLERDRIRGKALGVVISVDRDRYLPRWWRFFHSLP